MHKYLLLQALLYFNVHAADEVIASFDEKRTCVPETDDCQSTLTISTNRNVYVFENLLGSFHHSTTNNQIFDCGGDTLSYAPNANLINANGSTLRIVHNNGVGECGLTPDQRYYFIIDETPVLSVYDNTARLLLSKPVSFQSTVKYKINNLVYEVWVPGIP
ncbi:hypothetical protein EXU30_17760 [Shewanella maritima]|uniref:Uncharacterized protein n=1 Tax=Shewanella maritima TaxID=2520507 RepID=A0A411PLF5_9GAMM|nr:hypothetical protein [Shewanella maritima]QBF84314.1 hypothetical protein EXU30_17760 [Shewanella maritima]